MHQNASISFNPSLINLSEIEGWLIEEDRKNNEGFYCNWKLIKKSFEEKCLAVISFNNSAIGFITWYESELVATIDICEIKPTERGKGYLKILFTEVCAFFLKKNIVTLSLECAPASSEVVWRKLGFIDFPEMPKLGIYSDYGNKKLYKVLISNVYENEEIIEGSETIELWNVEPHEKESIAPIWKTQISFQTNKNKLQKWIIFPCKPDLRIRWRKGNEIYKVSKVKYFQPERIEFGAFLIIKRLVKGD